MGLEMNTSVSVVFLLLPFFFATGNTDTTGASNLDAKIYNGYPAQIADTKHQVSIRLKVTDSFIFGLGHICGGSLISPSVVLTAAHCMRSWSNAPLNETQLVVAMGMLWRNIRDNNTLVYNVKSYMAHPNFNKTNISYDIAYVKLDGEVPSNHPTVQPIPLIGCKVQENTLCQVTGWGLTEEKIPSDQLLQVDVRTIDINVCNRGYEGMLVIVGQLCAGYMTGGKDACSGDSGGPLVCNGKLTGIVSFGDGCGLVNTPGIYTDVLFFRNWIEDLTFGEKQELPAMKCNSAGNAQLSTCVLVALVIVSKCLIHFNV